MMNKRGITPLIATVLLIGFTVALAAVIFNWGQGFTTGIQKNVDESTKTQLACSTELDFGISDVKCTSGILEYVQVTNKGNVGIRALKVRVYGLAGDVKIYDFNTANDMLEPFGVKKY